VVRYSKAPSIKLPNFVPSENPSTRYLLPKFVDFVEDVTDKNTKTVNDTVSALRATTKNRIIDLMIIGSAETSTKEHDEA